MPRPRNPLAGTTEWLLCRDEVRRIFERHKTPPGFFESYGPLVFGAVGPAMLTEAQGLALAALITRHRYTMPRLLLDVRRLFERKCKTTLFIAACWIAARWRMIRAEKPRAHWPWDDGTTLMLIERDTSRKGVSKQAVKDARELINSHAAEARKRPRRATPTKVKAALEVIFSKDLLRSPGHYITA